MVQFIPKVGPFRMLKTRMPAREVEKMFDPASTPAIELAERFLPE